MTAQAIEHITVNGAQLGYSVQGAGPDKPSLVLAHGYAMRATGGLYGDLLDLLAPRFAVHALDLRGHGASAGTVAGWSFEALADDVVAFSRALRFDRPVFVGHSFGAVIGLLAEIRHPGAFQALCLLSPGPADHRRDPVDTLDMLIEHGQDRGKLRDGFRQMFVREPGEMLERALDAVTLVTADVHRAQKEQGPHFSIDDRLKDIAAPVLLVCGESDQVVPPDRQHDMARKLPHAKEVVFSSEGHMLANERPAVAATEILAFFDQTDGLKTGGTTSLQPLGKVDQKTRVLLIGIEPGAVDLSDPDLPPGTTADKIARGIDETLLDMRERGWEAAFCSILPDDSAESTIAASLAERWDCIVIGGGIRVPSRSLPLFERVMNAVCRNAPGTPIAFNTSPADSADAATRWLSNP